jgi:hypothetical protein
MQYNIGILMGTALFKEHRNYTPNNTVYFDMRLCLRSTEITRQTT